MNTISFSLFIFIQIFSVFPALNPSSFKNITNNKHERLFNYNYLVRSKWVSYGPLRIDLASIRYKNNSRIYQAYNSNSKPIYIAINCLRKNINVTNQRLEWKGWEPPFRGFEFSILNDLCLMI